MSVFDCIPSLQMTQNMFQEGLYQVFFKSSPPSPAPRQLTQVINQGELVNVRINRWFGTVVNARLLVAGVSEVTPLPAQFRPAESQLKPCVCLPPRR